MRRYRKFRETNAYSEMTTVAAICHREVTHMHTYMHVHIHTYMHICT